MAITYADPVAQQPLGRLDLTNPAALVMLDGRDKIPFAVEQIRRLTDAGWSLYGTRGTATFLGGDNGIHVVDVEQLIGYDPALDHRMASNSWETGCGLISDQNKPAHDAYLTEADIAKFQLLVDTVYGLDEEMRNPASTWQSRLEKTDFGGPAALRAAAKGRRAVVFRLDQLEDTINHLLAGTIDSQWLEQRAADTEHFCAWYAGMSAANISGGRLQTLCLEKVRGLRRGENPYETGAMLMRNAFGHDDPLTLDKFDIVGDTEPGWVNWDDINSSLNSLTTLAAVMDINGYLAGLPFLGVVVKHGNPVGLAVAATPEEAIRLTLTGNQRAAFGGMVMFNFKVDKELVRHILRSWLPKGKKYRYLVGVVAPEFTPEAIELLRGKDVKKQLLVNPALASLDRNSVDLTPKYRQTRGTALTSNGERYLLDLQNDDRLKKSIRDQHNLLDRLIDLLIAFAACATSTSNTISCAKDHQLVGNGLAQGDRVGCCELALKQARRRARGSAVVSDSYFPDPDGPRLLVKRGVATIMCTTGSRADAEVLQLIEAQGNINLFTIDDADGRLFLR